MWVGRGGCLICLSCMSGCQCVCAVSLCFHVCVCLSACHSVCVCACVSLFFCLFITSHQLTNFTSSVLRLTRLNLAVNDEGPAENK